MANEKYSAVASSKAKRLFAQHRHIRDDGSEYWSGRDLMPSMGHHDWVGFQAVIERAMTSAKAQGKDVDGLFAVQRENSRGCNWQDVLLTREAARLVAMMADDNKVEIQAAQAYFVARTERDERAEIGSFEMDLRTPRDFPDALRAYAWEIEEREALESFVLKLEPKAEPSGD